MPLKRIADNESGITYSLEAIIGVLLIIGTIIYLTGNMPYTAQKTGDYSKVQLMNIGRDNLDLTLITPAYELGGEGKPAEKYILTADRYTNILPGETVNFTVYDVNGGALVKTPLYFNGTTLIISNSQNITSNINSTTVTVDGIQSWRNVASGIVPNGNYTYSIQAYDSNSPVVGMSNFTTIKVGYYNLESTTSISNNGNVSGVVTNSSGSGVGGLKINIFDINMNDVTDTPFTITDANGRFTFLWSAGCKNPCNTGTYFIQAINITTGNVSNKNVFEFSQSGKTLCASYNDVPSCDNITVEEGKEVSLWYTGNNLPGGNFWVNYNPDATASKDQIGPYIITDSNGKNATFKASIPGIYSVYIGSCSNIWTSCAHTNIIVIYVIPVYAGPIENTCVNATNLNAYMRRYIPLNVNYNLYLIAPTGNKFTKCPDFPKDGVINGFPTAEAVTVNKLVHIDYIPTKTDNITEYRMMLWYK